MHYNVLHYNIHLLYGEIFLASISFDMNYFTFYSEIHGAFKFLQIIKDM